MMVTHAPLTDTTIHDAILRAMQNVCHTMLKEEARFTKKTAPEAMTDKINFELLGSVGFAGKANGIVYLCMNNTFAMHAVNQVIGGADLGTGHHDLIKDVIGELTNITAGGFKNALCDLGYPCKLTLPTIARGHNLRVATLKDTQRHVFHFDCAGQEIVADIQFRIN